MGGWDGGTRDGRLTLDGRHGIDVEDVLHLAVGLVWSDLGETCLSWVEEPIGWDKVQLWSALVCSAATKETCKPGGLCRYLGGWS